MEYKPQIEPRGPAQARILIVGEAPGEAEIDARAPFVGPSGRELVRMLNEAGISEGECRFTNVLNIRPDRNDFEASFMFSSKKAAKGTDAIYHQGQYVRPIVLEGLRELQREIETCRPNVIVPVGNIPLWGTTGHWGITKWRRSELTTLPHLGTWKVVPTYHPAAILRTWEWRNIAVQDFRVIRRESAYPELITPDYDFLISPSYSDVLAYLEDLEARVSPRFKLAVDVETRNRQIACVGLARDHLHAICIPFQSATSPNGSYWTLEEEVEIVWRLRRLLERAHVIGQNFAYDNQYFARNYGFVANLRDDTLFQQHVAFPGLPKGLDFISSMYREHHTYWKDEGKTWDKNTPEEVLWRYNCIDAVATYESSMVLENVVRGFGLEAQYQERLLTQRNAFTMMLRGTNSDMEAKLKLGSELGIGLAHMREWWDYVVGYNIFGKQKGDKTPGVSAPAFKKFVYELLKLPNKYTGKGAERRLTANKEACEEWEESCDPIYRPLLAFVRHYRSMLVFKSTFADQALDFDNRWRCTNNAGHANTFRWTTSEDAFGFGTNLQNIPKGDKR